MYADIGRFGATREFISFENVDHSARSVAALPHSETFASIRHDRAVDVHASSPTARRIRELIFEEGEWRSCCDRKSFFFSFII